MYEIKIDVTGNIARVVEKPSRITSGTVGLPVEFTFDSQWANFRKVAVFQAGNLTMSVDMPATEAIVPWEVLMNPGVRLNIGVYGTNADGSVAIPTIWANVGVINIGVNPDEDQTITATLPIWKTMMNYLASISTKPSAKIVDVNLPASAWEGSGNLYSQVVAIDGVTEYSQVDLKPSVQQLAIFHNKDVSFNTENDGGVVTVYAVGQKPENDYTIQATITEVYV